MTTKKSKKSSKKAPEQASAPKGTVACPDCGAPIWVVVNEWPSPVMLGEAGPDCGIAKVAIRSVRPEPCSCGFLPAVVGPRKGRSKWGLQK